VQRQQTSLQLPTVQEWLELHPTLEAKNIPWFGEHTILEIRQSDR
jgi:hypothetical protein